VRRVVLRMQPREDAGHVAVASEREEHARAGSQRHAEGRETRHDRRQHPGPASPRTEEVVCHEDERRARLGQVGIVDHPHHHPQEQHVDGRARPEGDEDGARNVLRRLDDLLGGDGDEIEAHVGDVDEAHRGKERAETHRGEGLQVSRLHVKGPEQAHAHEHDELHDVHHRDRLERLGLPAVVRGHEDHRRGQHDEYDAEFGKEIILDRQREDDGVERAGQRVADPEEPARQERHRVGQRPAHERVATPGNGDGGTELAVAERGEKREPAHEKVGQNTERPGRLGHLAGQRKDARTHHGADANHHGHEESDVALEPCLLSHERGRSDRNRR